MAMRRAASALARQLAASGSGGGGRGGGALLSAAAHSSGQGGTAPAAAAVRGFSLWPGRRDEGEAAGAGGGGRPVALEGGDPPPAAAALSAGGAAGAAPGPLTADAVVSAAGAAEAAAMAEALEGAWAPTRALIWALDSAHGWTGLPWWQAIALTTAAVRSATLPVALAQVRNTHRLSAARPEVEALVEHLKAEQARGNPAAVAEYQRRVAGVWAKHGANPIKGLAGILVQAPILIGFFSALRALAAARLPSLAEGGALWFTDLTVADPTYAMPVLAAATFLATVELGAADGMDGQPEATRRRMKNILRFVAVGIVPLTVSMPAAVFCYWTASNIFSLAQTAALKAPAVRAAAGLPPLARAAAGGGGGGGGGAAAGGGPVPTFAHRPPPKKGGGARR